MFSNPNISKQRHKEKFNTLFKQHYNNVVYYACSYLHDKSIAEEIAQDVFYTVWENIDKIDDNAFPYIIVVARNKCINYLKKEKNRQIHKNYVTSLTAGERINYHSLLNSGIETVLGNEAYEIFYRTINSMPEKTKQAFCLNRFYNKTYSEIAQIQNVSVKNIEYRIMSALKILRKNLADFLTICLGLFISHL